MNGGKWLNQLYKLYKHLNMANNIHPFIHPPLLHQVNGVNIEALRHSEVVSFIRGGGDETCLLVVDAETDELFKRLGVTPTSTHVKGQRTTVFSLSLSRQKSIFASKPLMTTNIFQFEGFISSSRRILSSCSCGLFLRSRGLCGRANDRQRPTHPLFNH